MQASTTGTPTRRPWFWHAAAYTAAWVACLVALESVVIGVMRHRIDTACNADAEREVILCGLGEVLGMVVLALATYVAVIALGVIALSRIRRRRLRHLRPAWIVGFVTVFGQVVAGMAAVTAGAILHEATVRSVVMGALWLAAPMVGMRMWLLSGERARAGVSEA